jgi:hypothetical protein
VALVCEPVDCQGFSKGLRRPTAFAAVDSIVHEARGGGGGSGNGSGSGGGGGGATPGDLKFHYVVVEVRAAAVLCWYCYRTHGPPRGMPWGAPMRCPWDRMRFWQPAALRAAAPPLYPLPVAARRAAPPPGRRDGAEPLRATGAGGRCERGDVDAGGGPWRARRCAARGAQAASESGQPQRRTVRGGAAAPGAAGRRGDAAGAASALCLGMPRTACGMQAADRNGALRHGRPLPAARAPPCPASPRPAPSRRVGGQLRAAGKGSGGAL